MSIKLGQPQFNLALYKVILGDAEEAGQIYQQGLAADETHIRLRDAINDLDNLMKLFPMLTDAQRFRQMLQVDLEKMRESLMKSVPPGEAMPSQ